MVLILATARARVATVALNTAEVFCPRRPVLAAVVVAAMPARKTKSLSRAKRPSLIAPGDVEDVFDDHAVELLARMAKLPPNADVARFATALRVDVHNYLQAKRRLGIPQLRAAIERLYQLNKRAEHGNDRAAGALARAVSQCPPTPETGLPNFARCRLTKFPQGEKSFHRQRAKARSSV